MTPSRVFSGRSALLGTALDEVGVFEQQPSTIPAGFDSVLQFSSFLLHRTRAANLAKRGLNPLSVRVPYQPDVVSAFAMNF